MKPLRIVLFFTRGASLQDWRDTGTLQRDLLLYERLAEEGHAISLITYGNEEDREILPATSPIRVLTKPPGISDNVYARRIHKIHRKALEKTDLIKSHQVKGAASAAFAAWRLKKPYLARCGYLPSVFAREEARPRLERLGLYIEEGFSFRSAKAVAVPSVAEADYIARRYRVPPLRITLCPNWVDTNRFCPDPAITRHPRRICFVGRLEPQKQPLFFLTALQGIPEVEAIMVGDGHLKEAVEAEIRKRKLNVKLLSRVPNEDLPQFLNASTLYAFPTRYEGGSPKTLLEAMACGLPVVSTTGFGVTEAYEHGVQGLMCGVDDLVGFRKALCTLLDDPAKACLMGERARSHVVEQYSIERALERERALLSGLVGTH
ncbi:MAG: glycosyltransferase family 4 protein [Planctomycetota bacterium]